ncbi:MAG: hypothetical protein FJ387_00105 [Verrucomicrobia bacterium]|nr:hypothetical protein [Verrucomicrobiota bacterium]
MDAQGGSDGPAVQLHAHHRVGQGSWAIGSQVADRPRRPGHGPDWWKAHFDDQPVANQVKHFATLNRVYPFHQAQRDWAAGREVLTERGQGADYRAALFAKDRAWALVYVPHGKQPGSVTIRLDPFASPMRARWFDPTSGVFSKFTDPLPPTGTRAFTAPGTDHSGQRDFVLVLDRMPCPPALEKARGFAGTTGGPTAPNRTAGGAGQTPRPIPLLAAATTTTTCLSFPPGTSSPPGWASIKPRTRLRPPNTTPFSERSARRSPMRPSRGRARPGIPSR